MMKRMLAFVLCLALLCIALAACVDEAGDTDAPSDGETPAAAEPVAPEDLPSVRKLSEFAAAYFSHTESNTALELMLPADWTVQSGNGYHSVSEDGGKVATVFAGESDEGMTLATTKTAEGVTVKTYIGMLTRSKVKEPYYQVVYSFTDDARVARNITVEVKQSAMDGALMQWLSRPKTQNIMGYHDIPTLSLDGENGESKILILGNSFVHPNNSAISDILKEMIAAGGKTCTVDCCSISYATVSKYVTDTAGNYVDVRLHIASDGYDLVLMCGLYDSGDVSALEDMIELCEQAGSRLVLLPAHNEGATHIASALSRYEGLPCLNWKQEIDSLIESGISRDLFCKNDAHSHSTKLGGYVGAHMIYRALFGELPPDEGYAYDGIIQAELIEPLGNYVTDGVRHIAEDQIHRLY